MFRTSHLAVAAKLFIILAGTATLLYAWRVEPRWVEETRWELPCAEWQGRPLRLAVLADLHARPGDGPYIDSIVQRTLASRPDAVLLLGDYMGGHSAEQSMSAEQLARHLQPLAQLPCYAVMGNHDYYYGIGDVRAMLQQLGVNIIEGKVEQLNVGGDTLCLGGLRCLYTYSRPGRVPSVPEPGKAFLLLSHCPVGAHFAQSGTTATLAAHTHGGQICLPGGFALARPDSRTQWHEIAGETQVDGRPLYVTRGLGTSVLPLRLFCRPELCIVELKAAR